MNDFLTDEEMEQLSVAPSSPAPQAHTEAPQSPDFLTDEEMEAHAPVEAPTLSDGQMEAMTNPDHAAVNEAIRAAVDKGMTKDQVIALAGQYGVDGAAIGGALDQAIAWRQRHGSYKGYVDVFRQAPDIRTQPQNEVSTLDAVGAGLGQGLTFGFGDEVGAGIGALANSAKGLVGAGTGEGMGDFYARVRDENRDYLHDAEDQHGGAFIGGQIVGSLPTAAIGGLGANGGRLIGRAALEGGLYGVGGSEADTVGGVAADGALGAVVGGSTAGLVNRAGTAISPRVAPIVDKLMANGIELTPTQILRAGGGIGKTVGKVIEKVGQRGAVTREAMRGAEARGRDSLDVLVQRQENALAQARAQGLNATPRHPDMVKNAEAVIGKPRKEASQVEMIANLLAGYTTSGATLAADVATASLFTVPGTRIANGLLTGRQGPVPKALRGIVTKASPLAGNAAASPLPYTER